MNYKIEYEGKTARVVYFGNTTEEDIRRAHFALSGDERFYDCQNLILDVSQCSLEAVSVRNLTIVVATDLGASHTNKSLKVAFIAIESGNVAKVTKFIERSKISPWEMRVFGSENEAREWFDE